MRGGSGFGSGGRERALRGLEGAALGGNWFCLWTQGISDDVAILVFALNGSGLLAVGTGAPVRDDPGVAGLLGILDTGVEGAVLRVSTGDGEVGAGSTDGGCKTLG